MKLDKYTVERCAPYMKHLKYPNCCPKSEWRCRCETCIENMKEADEYNRCTCGLDEILECLKTS